MEPNILWLDASDIASRDYRGSIQGKQFRVQIREDAAPHWYDSDLDSDERAQVLDMIDDLELQ